MSKEIFKGHWNEIKGKLKQQWADLTDDDILQIEGNYDEMQGKLQKKYGYEKDKAKHEVDTFLKRYGWTKES